MTKRLSLAVFCLSIVSLVWTARPAFADPAGSQPQTAAVGSPAPDFSGVDSKGQTQRLSSYLGKVVVLEWMNFDCPFSKKHYRSNNMQTLQKNYTKKGVVWLSIISSAPDKQGYYKPDEINMIEHKRKASPNAVLIDAGGAIGRLYDAKTTPDMFVIDRKGIMVYSGAIDDKPTTDVEDVPGAHSYLKDALNAVLSGKPVPLSYVKSYGCSVKYAD